MNPVIWWAVSDESLHEGRESIMVWGADNKPIEVVTGDPAVYSPGPCE